MITDSFDAAELVPPATAAAQTSNATPRLRQNTRLNQQTIRGERWWIIEQHETGINYRFDQNAYDVISQLDGTRSVSDIAKLNAQWDEAQLARLMTQLIEADLIQFDERRAVPTNAGASVVSMPNKAQMSVKNPLAIKIPLWDPDNYLTSFRTASKYLFNKTSLVATFALIVVGAILAMQHINELGVYTAIRAQSLTSIGLLLLAYPLVKGIHELAHAVAIKHYGGEVHEVGIMLLVFFPVPYVDASASNAFQQKSQRITVACVGILAELGIAAAGIVLWCCFGQGIISDLALSMALVGGISSIVFNGNPLLRFDGYYALTDWLEIPNLATRSRAYCLFLIRRLLGAEQLFSPVTGHGEKPWLFGYFIMSGLYRLVILTGIALFLIPIVPLIGLSLAIFAVFMQVILPILKMIRYLLAHPELSEHRPRSCAISAAAIMAFVIIFGIIPVPNWHSLQGVVRMPEASTIRADASGFVTELTVTNGEKVRAGEQIAIIVNDELNKESTRLRWRLSELEARRALAAQESVNEALQIADAIKVVQDELDNVDMRLQSLKMTAPMSGQLQYVDGVDWLGRFVKEGQELAHVISKADRQILTDAPESMIADIRDPRTEIFLRSIHSPDSTVKASIKMLTPSSTSELTNAALGNKHGGELSVDSREESGTHSLEQVYPMELIPLESADLLPGSRVNILFVHPKETIFAQISDATTRLLMRQVQW